MSTAMVWDSFLDFQGPREECLLWLWVYVSRRPYTWYARTLVSRVAWREAPETLAQPELTRLDVLLGASSSKHDLMDRCQRLIVPMRLLAASRELDVTCFRSFTKEMGVVVPSISRRTTDGPVRWRLSGACITDQRSGCE